MSPTERVRVTVGLTPAGSEALTKVMSTKWFATEMDAYKVAIAVALRSEINVDQPLVGVTTKFNMGSLDPDGKLVALIESVFGARAGDPGVLAERLAEQGLGIIATKLLDHEERLTDVLGIPSDSPSNPES